MYLAIENDLEIIPVLNKIDLPAADPERVSEEIINLLGCDKEDIIPVSAKTGKNVEAILDAVMERIPEPLVLNPLNLPYQGEVNNSSPDKGRLGGVSKQELKALVFDSQYDSYRGVVSYVKVFS